MITISIDNDKNVIYSVAKYDNTKHRFHYHDFLDNY